MSGLSFADAKIDFVPEKRSQKVFCTKFVLFLNHVIQWRKQFYMLKGSARWGSGGPTALDGLARFLMI